VMDWAWSNSDTSSSSSEDSAEEAKSVDANWYVANDVAFAAAICFHMPGESACVRV
jgi:hypothetical protein